MIPGNSSLFVADPPIPYITQPYTSGFNYGDAALIKDDVVPLSAVDLTDSWLVTSTLFEYSVDGGLTWLPIDLDENVHPEATDNIVWFDNADGYMLNGTGQFGWKIDWDTSGLPEGQYLVRATMNNGSMGVSDPTPVFIDRTPPDPTFTSPGWEEKVSGTVPVTLTSPDENIVNLEVQLQNKAEVPNIVYGDTTVTQTNLGSHDQHDGVSTDGSATGDNHCGPTAAKNALERLIPTADATENLARAQKLAEKMQTSETSGTTNGNFNNGLIDYLKEIGKDSSFSVTRHTTTTNASGTIVDRPRWDDFESALRSGESVVALICKWVGPGLDGVKGTADDQWDYGHYITMKDKDSVARTANNYKVSLVDPWDGGSHDSTWTTTNATDTGDTIEYPPGSGNGWDVMDMWEISPRPHSAPPSYSVIGSDNNPGNGWQVLWDTSGLPDGYYVLRAEFTDADGNKGARKQVVRVNNAPVTSLSTSPALDGDNGWYKTLPDVTLTTNETATIRYQWDSTSTDGWIDSFFDVSVDVTGTQPGTSTLYYYSIDTLENTETVNSREFKIDNTDPAGTVTINSDAPYTKSKNVTLNLSASDSTGSGLAKMHFKNDGGTWSAWQSYAAAKSWTLTSANGTKKVWAQFKDKAGNLSTAVCDTIILDTVKPSASLSTPGISTKTSKTRKFKVKWRGADSGSGIASYIVRYRFNARRKWKTWKKNTTARSAYFKGRAGRTYYFRVRAKDKAGNRGSWSAVKRTIVPYDDNRLIKRRKGFSSKYKNSSKGFYLGTVRFSTKRGDALVYKFTGKSVALITTKARNRGGAKIYIDGKLKKRVNAYSQTAKYRKVIFSKRWRKSRTHRIKIINLGIRGRRRFDVDGLAVRK